MIGINLFDSGKLVAKSDSEKDRPITLSKEDGLLLLEIESSVTNTAFKKDLAPHRSHRLNWLNSLKQFSNRFFCPYRPHKTDGNFVLLFDP